MPIVASTLRMRTDGRRNQSRSHSAASTSRLNRSSKDKPFVPPGKFHSSTVHRDDDPRLSAPPRPNMAEHPIKRQKDTLKPFVPGGATKHQPIAHEHYQSANEASRIIPRSTKRTTREEHRSTSPAFIPAGSVREHLSSSPPRIHATSMDSVEALRRDGSPPKPAGTEYSAQFREWDLPRKHVSSVGSHLSPLSTYHIDLSASNWESENRHAYRAHPEAVTQGLNERIAGRPSHSTDPLASSAVPSSEAKKRSESTSPTRLRVTPAPRASPHRQTETVAKFQWPARSQRIVHTQPPNQRWNPVPHDPALADAAKWSSEYDEQCQLLRKQQQGLQADAAGISTTSTDNNPTFFAWNQSADNSAAPPPPPPAVTEHSYNMGTSEYKTKFQPWPLEEVQADRQTVASAPATSRVLRGDDVEDAYAHLRQTSEYRDNFTKKAADLAVPTQPAQKADPSPMAFAWQPETQHAQQTPAMSSGYSQDATSEYNRKFQWPMREEDYKQFSRTASKPDARPKGLNLFDDTQPLADGTRGVRSVTEYRGAYVEKDVSSGSPPRHHGHSSDCPPQFAWPSNTSQEDKPARPLRTTLCKDDSEMHCSYQWPPAGAAGSSTFKAEELKQADEGQKVGKVFALDRDSTAAKWRTEYEEKFQALRSQTRESLGLIAGVPSAKKPVVPPFYAWPADITPPPPPSGGVKTRHVSPDHFRTEHGDKFLAWDATAASQDKPTHVAGSSLNLFAPPAAAGETVPSPVVASEYKDKFKAVASPSSRGEEVGTRFHKEPQPDIPAQFAWPLLQDEMPRPPPPAPRRASLPLETSEYASKYAWPAPQPPAVSAEKALTEDHVAAALRHLPPSSTAISTDSAGSLEVDWTTEYDAQHNARTLQTTKSLPAPAGLIVVKDEDVPAFFAWADQEEHKPVPAPPRQPSGVALTTEYSDQFRTKRSEPVAPVASLEVKKHGGQGVDHISSLHILDSDSRTTPLTEYDANYQAFAVASQSTVDFVKREQERQAQRPPQFAWSLLPPPASSLPTPPPRPQAPFEGISEYDRCFRPIASTTSSLRDTGVDKEMLSGHRSNPLGLSEEDKSRSVGQWQSEYATQCQSVSRAQTASTASPSSSSPPPASTPLPPPPPPSRTAGMANPMGMSAPSFFAWPAAEQATSAATAPREAHRLTESTEYARQYSSRPSSSLLGTASHPAPRRSSFDSFEFGGSRPLQGVSEYDAQFSTANTSAPPHSTRQDRETERVPAAKVVAERFREQQSLATTNLDPNYADSIVEQLNKSVAERPVRTAATPAEVSETAAQFAWPRTPRAVVQPTLTPHRSKVVIGGHIPRSAYVNLPNKENIASLINRVEEVEPAPLTEAQSQFRWPGAPSDPAVVVVSAKEKPSPRRKKTQSMRPRHGVAKYIDRPHVIPDRSYLYRPSPSHHLRNEDGSPRRFVYDHRGNVALKRTPRPSSSSRSPSPPPRQTREQEAAKERVAHTSTINTNTMMSRDSLAESSKGSTSGTTTGTVVSTKSKGSSVPSTVDVSPGSPSDRVGRLNGLPAGLQTNERVIPGLRAPDDPRARSAPPRRLISTAPMGKLYVDETTSNPVLLNRRYPAVSNRQSTRWATETMDSFKWRPRASAARRSLSP